MTIQSDLDDTNHLLSWLKSFRLCPSHSSFGLIFKYLYGRICKSLAPTMLTWYWTTLFYYCIMSVAFLYLKHLSLLYPIPFYVFTEVSNHCRSLHLQNIFPDPWPKIWMNWYLPFPIFKENLYISILAFKFYCHLLEGSFRKTTNAQEI